MIEIKVMHELSSINFKSINFKSNNFKISSFAYTDIILSIMLN